MSAFLFVVQIRPNPINLILKLNFNSRLIIVLSSMAKNGRNFIEKWCKTYPWLTILMETLDEVHQTSHDEY